MRKLFIQVATFFFSCCVFTVFSQVKNQNFNLPVNIKTSNYQEKTVIFKVKPQYRNLCSVETIGIKSLNDILKSLGYGSLYKQYPNEQAPASQYDKLGRKYVDLSLIYKFQYTNNVDLQKALNAIYNDGYVEYANPASLPKLQYTPNDPNIVFQPHLNVIKAFEAWDIEKGDTNVVIGIVDNGCQWDHPELAANVKINYADPINGIDDDGDGYIDNYRGWDLGRDDNDPNNDGPGILAHGTHVAGDADAVTDNGLQIASPGFKCKFLPVKITDQTGAITMGYEGIKYAADHGCSIINCSWGQPGNGLSYEQDIINYATINKNALVVAAAGNDNTDEAFYPASYDHVISVADVNNSDVKASISNYNYSVDVSAPGEGIYSTYYDSVYTMLSGTSMASPIAAGAAAIIKSHFPSYTAEQVGERLRVTADVIDTMAANSQFLQKLGHGRINMDKSLTNTAISVRSLKINTTDNNDNEFNIGDTLRIVATFANYLDPVSGLSIILSSPSPYIQVLQNSFNAGSMNTLDTVSNYIAAFEVLIRPGTPYDTKVDLIFSYNGNGYNDYEWFSEFIQPDYIDVAVNDVGTTITSKGRIGYNDIDQTNGLGFTYHNSPSLFFESSLMIGISSTQVSDMSRGAPNGRTDTDFGSVYSVEKVIPTVYSDFDLIGRFNDDPAGGNKIGVLVTHHCYAWTANGHRKYVIVEYDIKNTTSSTLNNLYAGIFADWDIQNFDHNRASYDATRKMGYAYCTDTGGLYAGIKLLSPGNPVHYAIDNIAGGGGGVDVYSTGYSTASKYITLSTNRTDAGISGQGNDISDVMSTGPFTIPPGDSVRVAFAMLANTSLAALQKSADSAQVKFNTIPITAVVNLTKHYLNPVFNTNYVLISLNESSKVSLDVFDAIGKRVTTIATGRLEPGTHELLIDISNWKDGLYFYRLTVNQFSETRKMVVIH